MKKKVLIVDDSLFVYEEMKHMLTDSPFEIVGYARSGEEALSSFQEVAPDVITMDIVLPGIDGMDAAEHILRQSPATKVVMVSSLAYDDTMQRSQEVGASAFLFKPFEKEQLLDALKRACD